MGKKIVKILFLILVIFGLFSGIYISMNKNNTKKYDNLKIDNVFGNLQSKTVTVTSFYTYGDSLNVAGSLSNVTKDNFENAKLILTDGENEITCNIETEIEEKKLKFTTSQINKAIELDRLSEGNYYVLLRLKLNNSANAKYYTLSNDSNCENIEYYTVTKNAENKKIVIEFTSKTYKDKEYKYLAVNVTKAEIVEGIYDFVIDAGHGGKDLGENVSGHTEADITLDYAKDLKIALEDLGLKVKLTRDGTNEEELGIYDMYGKGGRAVIPNEVKAKYVLSLHLNSAEYKMNKGGVEIYAPSNARLEFPKLLVDNLVKFANTGYSPNVTYRVEDGVYVRNFSKYEIETSAKSNKESGYEPYNLTTNTPYLFMVREPGGIATNAYVDGRNKLYGKNPYYNSNMGVESYLLELGFMNSTSDFENILNNRNLYVEGIKETFKIYLDL